MPKPAKIGEGRTLSRLAKPLPTNWAGAITIGMMLGILAIYFASKRK